MYILNLDSDSNNIDITTRYTSTCLGI
jgi:hypothetical protein